MIVEFVAYFHCCIVKFVALSYFKCCGGRIKMLRRKMYDVLLSWKKNKKKECLLVNGARQVVMLSDLIEIYL